MNVSPKLTQKTLKKLSDSLLKKLRKRLDK